MEERIAWKIADSLERIADGIEKIHKQLCCLTEQDGFKYPLDEIVNELKEIKSELNNK